MNRLSACFVIAAFASACSSNPSQSDIALDRSVALRDFRRAQRFELVNEAQRSRIDQYSQVRSDANTKIQTNEIMATLAEYLREHGFDEFGQPGSLPEQVAEGIAWGMELREGAQARYVLGYPPGFDLAQQQKLRDLRVAFLETYNQTYSLQAVEVKPGETPFKAPATPQKRP